jgi:hypothetical protein
VRCLTREQAAEYLGVGVTLLAELGVPFVKFGRRCVYDTVDLDAWLDEYKQRGRAGKETSLWPVKKESTGEPTLGSGGSMQSSPTAREYARVLGLNRDRTPKRC